MMISDFSRIGRFAEEGENDGTMMELSFTGTAIVLDRLKGSPARKRNEPRHVISELINRWQD